VVVGFRPVRITADGAVGAAAGAAAGGAVGGAVGAPDRVMSAIGAVGGAVAGGLIGTAAERAAGNTDGIEYIIRKNDGGLVSVTQRDLAPLPVGARVLVIEGQQARVVADYTVPTPGAPQPAQAGRVAPTPPVEPDHGTDLGTGPAQALDQVPGWLMGAAGR
jgi:outer membrane lipoprotein SlyB